MCAHVCVSVSLSAAGIEMRAFPSSVQGMLVKSDIKPPSSQSSALFVRLFFFNRHSLFIFAAITHCAVCRILFRQSDYSSLFGNNR